MQKTKLGLSVGLVGAILYFLGLFSGYLVTVAAVAYVLLKEENEWLKKTAVKVLVLTLIFPIINIVIGLIPNLVDCLTKIPAAFNIGAINYFVDIVTSIIDAFFDFLKSIVNIFKNVIFIILGFMAFAQKTVAIPGIDSTINKHMN